MSDLLTEAEVAKILRCSPKTVARRKLAHVRNGRLKLYERKDVEDFICRARQQGEQPSPPASEPKAERRTGLRAGRSRSGKRMVQLARDELSAALATTVKPTRRAMRAARNGIESTKTASETLENSSPLPALT